MGYDYLTQDCPRSEWPRLWDVEPVATMWRRNPRTFYESLSRPVWFRSNYWNYHYPVGTPREKRKTLYG